MPWKRDSDGNLVTEEVDGKPVPVRETSDGDKPFPDPDAPQRELKAANTESAQRKERIRKLTERIDALDPLMDLIGEEGDPADFAKEVRKLRRDAKTAGKSELDEETQQKIARLGELEEELAQTSARLKAADKKASELGESVTASQQTIHRLTAGREVQSSRWFRGQNGDDPLSRMHPAQAVDYLSPHGRPHPDDPERVVWYRTRKGAEAGDPDDLIRDPENGQAAGVDYALGEIGPTYGWWKGYLSDKGSTGTGADGKGGGGGLDTPRLSKADMRDRAKKAAFAKQYGAEEFQKELERHAEMKASA